MAYILDIFRFGSSIEYEYKYKGNYGAKGEKRQPKKKATPEEIAKHNQYNKVKTVRRLIKSNFRKGDYWTTLTYPSGTGKSIKEVTKDLKNFLDRLRRVYKRAGEPCKYIYRIEIGSRGGIHIHIVLNRIPDLDLAIDEKWDHGHTHNELLDDGTYEELAKYITKQPTESQMKLLKSIADSEDTGKLIRYSCSRNLTRPQPERHIKSAATMKRIFNHDLTPAPGYYIDKNSIVRGINPYTGMGYLHYQDVILTKGVTAEPVKICECPHCHQFTLDNYECGCQKIRKRGKRHG